MLCYCVNSFTTKLNFHVSEFQSAALVMVIV